MGFPCGCLASACCRVDSGDRLLGPGMTLDTSAVLQLSHLWAGPGGRGHAPGHLLDAVCPVVLIVHVAGHVLEVVHVRADQHVAKLHEVAVRLVLHCGQGWPVSGPPAWGSLPTLRLCPRPGLTLHDPPRVQTPPDPLPLGLHHRVAADNSERCALLGGGGRCKGSCPVSMGMRCSARGAWAHCTWSASPVSPTTTSPQRDPFVPASGLSVAS